jgi:hypothetical protein
VVVNSTVVIAIAAGGAPVQVIPYVRLPAVDSVTFIEPDSARVPDQPSPESPPVAEGRAKAHSSGEPRRPAAPGPPQSSRAGIQHWPEKKPNAFDFRQIQARETHRPPHSIR